VPVFWLQTEDHDLPEIAVCHVASPAGALTVPVPSANRISIAHCTLPEEVTECVAQLRTALGTLPHAEAYLARLARSYRPGTGWAEAFAEVLAELFAADGLVLIDPRDPTLAGVAASVHRRALTDATPIAAALISQTETLQAAGFAAAVHVRPDAPLPFYHPRGAAGPRYRLAPVSGGFAEVGGDGVHASDALLTALEAEPLRCSTSALLRPIVQDTLLPTAAYVAGPGEVAYFAQLAPLYAAYELPMPLVVPRARLRVLEQRTTRLLNRLALTADDAQRSEDDMLALARPADRVPFDRAVFARMLLDPFNAQLDAVWAQRPPLAPGCDTALEKTRTTVERAVMKLAAKVESARLHADHALVEEVRSVKQLLYPNGVPQERVHGLPYYAARYGDRLRRARPGGYRALRPGDARPGLDWK